MIFKHSTRCEISGLAKFRLEDGWSFGNEEIEPYLLDIFASRAVSNQVAEIFEVHHESPQILLIVGGDCVHDASHLDITVAEVREGIAAKRF